MLPEPLRERRRAVVQCALSDRKELLPNDAEKAHRAGPLGKHMIARRVSRVLYIAAVLFCLVRPCAAQRSVAEGTALLEKGQPLEAAALWREIVASDDDAGAAEALQKLEQHASTLERVYNEGIFALEHNDETLTLLTKAFPERAEPHLFLASRAAFNHNVEQTILHVTEAVNKGATLEDLIFHFRIGYLLDVPEKGVLFEKFVNESFGPEAASRLRNESRDLSKNPPIIINLGPSNSNGDVGEGSMAVEKAERQLTTAYTALRKNMNQEAKETLKREQIQWIKRKDAIIDPASRSKFIQERTAELKRRLDR